MVTLVTTAKIVILKKEWQETNVDNLKFSIERKTANNAKKWHRICS